MKLPFITDTEFLVILLKNGSTLRLIFFSFIPPPPPDSPLTFSPIPFCFCDRLPPLAMGSAEMAADFLVMTRLRTEDSDEASPLAFGVCVAVVADVLSAFFDLFSETKII